MWLGMRIVGTMLIAASAILFVAGFAYTLAIEEHYIRASAAWWSPWLLRGPTLGILGVLPGLVLALLGGYMSIERRWRRGVRRGSAILRNLRPVKPHCECATEALTCALDAEVAGMAPIRADYRVDVGPLDARWLVEGVALACEANPSLPGRVRVWLIADPMDRELTGRYLDFRPA